MSRGALEQLHRLRILDVAAVQHTGDVPLPEQLQRGPGGGVTVVGVAQDADAHGSSRLAFVNPTGRSPWAWGNQLPPRRTPEDHAVQRQQLGAEAVLVMERRVVHRLVLVDPV